MQNQQTQEEVETKRRAERRVAIERRHLTRAESGSRRRRTPRKRSWTAAPASNAAAAPASAAMKPAKPPKKAK